MTILSHVQGGTGAGDALSVYVVVCLLEARNFNVQVRTSSHGPDSGFGHDDL